MQCICCSKEFELIIRHGGQNRVLCYDCMPDGLPKKEKDKRRRDCLRNASDKLKESTGCAKCGYNSYGNALDWHHIDSSSKKAHPSKQLQKSWSSYVKEIEGCILLCANCHREYHYLERRDNISITDFL